VLAAGLEPATYALGERRSIQSELRELDSARISDPVKGFSLARAFSFSRGIVTILIVAELTFEVGGNYRGTSTLIIREELSL
jgi:hypothetical protein